MEQINLNLIPGRAMPVCHVSQYDVDRTIRCNLFEGDTVFALATGDTAEVHVRKPDDTVVTASLTVVNAQTYLDIKTTQQMDAVAGSNLCEIQLKRSGATLGTLNFIMDVEADPMDGGAIGSQSEIRDLHEQVIKETDSVISEYTGNIADMFSRDSELLGPKLSNKSTTASMVTYTLVGNTCTMSGTSTGNSAFTWYGGTSTPLYSWMRAGGFYVFDVVTTGTNVNFMFMVRTVSQNPLHSIGTFTKTGKYLVKIPEDTTAFVMRSFFASEEVADGTITVKMYDAVKPSELDNIYILHETGSFASGTATERISVFIPTFNDMVLYRLYHFEDNTNNSDCWQIYAAYKANQYFENQITLTVTGEWECAVHLDGRSDFSGGHVHGDEILQDITFLVDGQIRNASDFDTLTMCRELRIIENTELYDPNDSVTVIADHGRNYIFNVNGLVLEQAIVWKVAEALTNCFMAMFTPSKSQIDRAAVNSDFEVLELPTDTSQTFNTIVKPKGNGITMWDTERGWFCDVSAPVYPTGLPGGDQMSLSDNGGLNYNKVYFKVCGSGSSSVGEIWKSKTIYKIDYKTPA